MILQPLLGALMIGLWELVLIILMLGTPIFIAAMVLLAVFLAKHRRHKLETGSRIE